MKTYNWLFLTLFSIVSLTSCEFDNYDAPTLKLTGTLKYNGEPLNTKYGLLFKLYQYKEDGFVNAGAASIDLFVNQNGEYNALLFPGRYKMVVNSAGPIYYLYDWMDFPKNNAGELDTLYFEMKEDKLLDFEVMPYFQIQDFNAFYRNDSIITQFRIKKLTDKTDNSVKFRSANAFLSTSVHVNNDTPVGGKLSSAKVKEDELLEIGVPLKDYYTDNEAMYINNYRNYVYVRAGVSLRAAAQEFIYSNIVKVEGIPQETIEKFK